ncbi:hypothetical protein LTR15_011568 [Elasticomyces elasticus]|nr:hypothetical protein LTR15_011568 [Elasticomyces elasticus]
MSNVGPPYITHINYFCPAPEQHQDQRHTEPLDKPGHDNGNIYANEFALRGGMGGGFLSHRDHSEDDHFKDDHSRDDHFIRYRHACMQEQRRWAVEYNAMSGFQQAMLFDPALMDVNRYPCPYCATMGVRPPRQDVVMPVLGGPGLFKGMGSSGPWYEQNVMGQGMMPPPPQAAPYMPGMSGLAPNNLSGPRYPVAAPLVPAMPNIVPNNSSTPGRPAAAPGAHIVANQQPVYQAPVVAQAFAQASAGPSCSGHARHVREQEPAGILSRMYRALW